MRAATLLVASALALSPAAAHAQIAVIDPALNLQQVKQYFQDLKAYVTQNMQLLHEINTDLQTAEIYAQEVEFYLHVVENPQLLVSTLLDQTGLGSDLPVNPMAIMQLANGYHATNGGGLMGDLAILRMLSGFSSGAFAENHYYTCTGTDPVCAGMNARANGIAGSMGLAQATYADIQAHQAALQGLRDSLAGVTDPAQRETVIAQVGIEQAYLQNTMGKLQAAMQQANLAEQSDRQRTLERQRQSADAYFANTQMFAGDLTPEPPPPPVFAAN